MRGGRGEELTKKEKWKEKRIKERRRKPWTQSL
jgi:hypothetical protein